LTIARGIIEWQDPAVTVVSGVGGFTVCHPDRGECGAGERHPRQRGVVDAALRTVECVVSHQISLRGSNVDELRGAGDIAGRPDPQIIGAQVVIDEHLTPGAG
jgi:hypothetical protein